ncbi:MAG: FHA domain-containing protein [Planctomycetes bacterium]|nr:FHA domain-containing protein [Planctomycetota bacterium]
MIPFEAFARSHQGASRTAFVAEVRDPHLALWTALDDESDERPTAQFLTVSISAKRGDAGADEARGADPSAPLALLPVRKREGSNAFALMITIGRAPNNDLVLPDRRVSKFHAYFRRLGGAWTINDANSTNGTTVDEVLVPPERGLTLRSGARIVLGGAVHLEFLEGDDLFERMWAAGGRPAVE